jgi:hypothetical protein
MNTVESRAFVRMSPPQEWLRGIRGKYKLPAIQLSYHPPKDGSSNRWAEKNGMSDQELLALLKLDLSNGITRIESTKPTPDGRGGLNICGTHWKVTVVEHSGKTTGFPVCVLRAVNKIASPSEAPLIKPDRVEYHPIWEECRCDAGELKKQYQSIQREIKSAEHRLTHPNIDGSVRKQREALSKARKQYSALGLMMTLLRLKSEQEKQVFDAEVLASGDQYALPDDNPEADNENENVYLRLEGKVPSDTLDAGVLIEVIRAEGSRPLRTTILAAHTTSDGLVLELDLPADRMPKVGRVTLNTVSRFGMWAHERAVSEFLNEDVHGYWQNLAQLLCSPTDIVPPSQSASVSKFFCDEVLGAPRLNERQRKAVVGAVNAPSAFCIQGPPGTGKTTVICEIVQHLIARGERILMVAPTHVAIDEVLRRIGGRPKVHPIRLSWNESRVAEDIRQYLPNALSSPLFDAISVSAQSKVAEWSTERSLLEVSLGLLNKLMDALKSEQTSRQRRDNDKRGYEEFERTYAAQQSRLLEKLEEVRIEYQTRRRQRDAIGNETVIAREALESTRLGAGFWKSTLGHIGFGDVGKAKKRYTALSKQLIVIDAAISTHNLEENEQKEKLDILAKTRVSKKQAASDSEEDYVAHKTQLEQLLADCEAHPLLTGKDLDLRGASALHEQFSERTKRLAIYPRLADTFQELISSEDDSGVDRESLQRDLVNSANLFCCTTTGVASSRELRDMEFDTLIIDEASRVTDSEFLIGAVRAKRWLLVGDENQLPPYVEQQDEHFIHALSALQRSSDHSLTVEEAVTELGKLWHEDEELHKFRNDSVLRFATELQANGTWEFYREAYADGIEKLKKEAKDPAKALLNAMRESIVHSLFERVVASCPDGAKVRLSEQRRMIEPIARIVSEPVYGGDYQSPSAAELAKSGVTRLTTATFRTPITFLDTSLLGRKGRDELRRNSFVNEAEANLVVRACRYLERETAESSSKRITVSILAFYKAQARLIEEKLREHRFHRLQFSVIDAIDRIQGQESDVVFLSFTRTAGNHVSSQFGQWLQDIRRLNVACTRAHRALFFVGQKEMLARLHSNDQAVAFYKNLDTLFEQYPEDMTIIKHLGEI